MKTKKKVVKKQYIVEYFSPGVQVWNRSANPGADGEYTKTTATRLAKYQQEHISIFGLKYRAKETK